MPLNNPNVLDFNWNINPTYLEPLEVVFYHSPTVAYPGPVNPGDWTWSWDFGDGSPSFSSSTTGVIAHTYSEPGTYTVVLTVDDGTSLGGSVQDVTVTIPVYTDDGYYPELGINYSTQAEFNRLVRPNLNVSFAAMDFFGETNGSEPLDPSSILDLSAFTGGAPAQVVNGKLGSPDGAVSVSFANQNISSNGFLATTSLVPNSSEWSFYLAYVNEEGDFAGNGPYVSLHSNGKLGVGYIDSSTPIEYQFVEVPITNGIASDLVFRWDGRDRIRAEWGDYKVVAAIDGLEIDHAFPVMTIEGNIVSAFSSKVALGFTNDAPTAAQAGALHAQVTIDGERIMWPSDPATPQADTDAGESLSAAMQAVSAEDLATLLTVNYCPEAMRDSTDAPAVESIEDFAADVAAAVETYGPANVVIWKDMKGLGTSYADYAAIYSDCYDAIKAVAPGVGVFGPNVSVTATVGSGFDQTYSGLTLDSRYMDIVHEFLTDVAITIDGLAISADFPTAAHWRLFVTYLKETYPILANKKLVLTNIFNKNVMPTGAETVKVKIDTLNSVLGDTDIAITSNGVPFNYLLDGTSAPSSEIGETGDFYLDTTNIDLYGPKNDGVWLSQPLDYSNVYVSLEEPENTDGIWIRRSPSVQALMDFRKVVDGPTPSLTNGTGVDDPATILEISSIYSPVNDQGKIPCIDPVSFPPPPSGAMQYINYSIDTFHLNQLDAYSEFGIRDISVDFLVESSMGGNEDTYFQFYESDVDENHQYFGIQTDAGANNSEQLVIFSKWTPFPANREATPAEVRTYGDATYTISGSENNFISLRSQLVLDSGVWHNVTLTREEEESLTIDGNVLVGDWFDYAVNGVAVGGLWFERADELVPCFFTPDGATWTEYWANNNNTTLYPVPEQALRMKPIRFNGVLPYGGSTTATSVYSPMPNADTSYVQGDLPYEGYFLMKFGGDTPRCHENNLVMDLSYTNGSLNPFHDTEVLNGALYGAVSGAKTQSGIAILPSTSPFLDDFRTTVLIADFANQNEAPDDARFTITYTNNEGTGYGIAYVINEIDETALALVKITNSSPLETTVLELHVMDYLLSDTQTVSFGYNSGTWYGYIDNIEVLSFADATYDPTEFVAVSILLSASGDSYNPSIKYVALLNENVDYVNFSTMAYAYNGVTWIQLPEIQATGHAEFYNPVVTVNSYAWQFRSSLSVPAELTDAFINIVSYSDDIMYNGKVYVTGDTYSYSQEISGPGQTIFLGDLEPDTYTIDIYGDAYNSGFASMRLAFNADGMANPLYVSDSIYVNAN